MSEKTKTGLIFGLGLIAGWNIMYFTGISHSDKKDFEARQEAAKIAAVHHADALKTLPRGGFNHFSEGDQKSLNLLLDTTIDATMTKMLSMNCIGYTNPFHDDGLHPSTEDALSRYPNLRIPLSTSRD